MTDQTPLKIDDNQRAEIKREVISEIRHDERRRKLLGCLGCLAVEVALLLIPVVWLGVMVARSGWYEIPWMTERLYVSANPTRLVQPLVGANPDAVLSSAASRAKFNPTTNQATLEIKETELTTVVGAALVGSTVLPVEIKSLQAVILPQGIEILAILPRPARDVTAVVLLMPEVTAEGSLTFRLNQIRIGSLELPKFMVSMISSTVGKTLGESFSSGVGSIGRFTAVELRDGSFSLSLVPRR